MFRLLNFFLCLVLIFLLIIESCYASDLSPVNNKLTNLTQATNTINATPYTLSYQYDPVGNRTQVSYPSGSSFTYTYDQLNRLSTIRGVNPIARFSYDTLSRRTKLERINRMNTDYRYDIANRLTQLGNDLGHISYFTYTYDNVGNRLSMQYRNGEDNYGYDSVYQLISVSGNQVHNYDYDSVGNREVVDGTTYTTNNLNQYTNVGTTPYQYDTNGNLTNDGVNTYTYDYENRLVTASGGGHNSSYDYDGLGRRISKTVDGEKKQGQPLRQSEGCP